MPARPLPDVQILFTAAPLAAWPYFAPFKQPFADGFATRIVAIQPESRGTCHACLGRSGSRAADPPELPVLAARLGNRCAPASAWRASSPPSPPCRTSSPPNSCPGPKCQTDDEIDEHIRKTSITVHHPAGTCRMGADAASVVDPELRVRGIEGLRVVDASVMPDLPCGNINAAVIMIAEKAADMIRASCVTACSLRSLVDDG